MLTIPLHQRLVKILSGGVDANALHRPKRFFGAARNVEEGGSLTIIATALVDTGSKWMRLSLKNLKVPVTWNYIFLAKSLKNDVFPAIDFNRSGTRKEDLLTTLDELQKCGFFAKSEPNGRSGSDGIPHRQTYGGETNDEFLKL